MKTVYRLGSLIVVAAVIFGASRLWAENKGKKSALRTRIGVLNLTFVIKNCDKFKHFQEEIKSACQVFKEQDEKLRARLAKLRTQVQDKKSGRRELERTEKEIQKQLEDNNLEAKKKLGERNDLLMKNLYKDIEETVERYAAAHGLELVLQYNDAVTKEDFESAQNIARKLNTGALMPVYMVSGIDISTEILDDLNQRNPGGN